MNLARAVFRVDASLQIGTGHVMRCLTLANGLAKHGVISTFLCRDHDGHLADTIRSNGHSVHMLDRRSTRESDGKTAHSAWLGTTIQNDAMECREVVAERSPDVLVVDHYALDASWREALTYGAPLFALDDLADRPIDADVLLDQNLGRLESDYDGLLPPSARRLIGPQYALLRPEFAQRRDASLTRRHGRIERVLVALGGVDQDNATSDILRALARLDIEIDVVLGATAPHVKEVTELAQYQGATVHIATNQIATLMHKADLAIGGAGTTSWERCALGLPTIVLVLADNQRAAADALAATGAAWVIHSAEETGEAIRYLGQEKRLLDMAKCTSHVTDGRGLSRVLEVLML